MLRKLSQSKQYSAKRWANYAKAAGLGAFALGATSNADAAIVKNGGTYNGAAPAFPLVINPVSYAGANAFDIDGDTINDFGMGTGNYNSAFGFEGTGSGTIFTSGHPADYAMAFAGGALIDGNETTATAFYGAEVLSKPSFVAPGYMGFQTSNGSFGWMSLTLSENSTPLTVITIHEWAINDMGGGIQAGTVPEPNSLALLAAGSIGLLARRRLTNAA